MEEILHKIPWPGYLIIGWGLYFVLMGVVNYILDYFGKYRVNKQYQDKLRELTSDILDIDLEENIRLINQIKSERCNLLPIKQQNEWKIPAVLSAQYSQYTGKTVPETNKQ